MNIIELAHEAGYGDIEAWLDDESRPFLERFAALVRAEALEEAKKTCDEICQKAIDSGYTVKGETFIDGFGDGACACVAAIRGLK